MPDQSAISSIHFTRGVKNIHRTAIVAEQGIHVHQPAINSSGYHLNTNVYCPLPSDRSALLSGADPTKQQ